MIAVIGGIIAGAPYAVLNPEAFLNGMTALARQYSGGHPPHSLADPSFWRQLFWIVSFHLVLYGPLPLGLFAIRRLPPLLMGVGIYSIAMILYFSTQAVFFERNLCLVIFSLILVSGYVAGRMRGGYLIIATMLVPMVYWSLVIAFTANTDWRSAKTFEVARFGKEVPHVWAHFAAGGHACPIVVGVLDYGDEYSRSFIETYRASGLEFLETLRSPFEIVPTSTLQPYLRPGVHYFGC
jgi:hypothetical protein